MTHIVFIHMQRFADFIERCDSLFLRNNTQNRLYGFIVSVFYDVNLRPSICSIEKSREIFAELSPYITHLISNKEHVKQLLEIQMPQTEDPSRLFELTKTVQSKTNIHNIAITVRGHPAPTRQ